IISARRGAGTRRHFTKARLAASTAVSTSALPDRWKIPTTSRVSAGLRFSKVWPVEASTHSPSMKFLYTVGWVELPSRTGVERVSVAICASSEPFMLPLRPRRGQGRGEASYRSSKGSRRSLVLGEDTCNGRGCTGFADEQRPTTFLNPVTSVTRSITITRAHRAQPCNNLCVIIGILSVCKRIFIGAIGPQTRNTNCLEDGHLPQRDADGGRCSGGDGAWHPPGVSGIHSKHGEGSRQPFHQSVGTSGCAGELRQGRGWDLAASAHHGPRRHGPNQEGE